jgi:hypothetical protein
MKTVNRRLRRIGLAAALAAPIALTGCSTAGEGAVSGAGIGALTGLVFGSMVGDAGEGAVLGTAAGAVVGGVIGDQNDRAARNSARQAEAYRDAARYGRYERSGDDPYRHRDWSDRYERRSEPRSERPFYRYERYEEYRPQSSVIIRYSDRPSYKHRTYRRHSGWNFGFGYSDCW